MAKPWVLTRQADAALRDIAEWTVRNFGERQALVYAEDLIGKCQALAYGEAPSRDCRILIDPNLIENLRFAREGQHYIVFIDGPEQLIVIDFLHVRMDLPARLASLSGQV